MNSRQVLKCGLDMAEFIALGYLEDLTDQEMLHRPAPDANHIKWQFGHLILSENQLVGKIAPGQMPTLPDGFIERYSKETANSDSGEAFDSKAELIRVFRQQRAATLRVLETMADEDFDRPSGIEYSPTVGAIFSMQGSHLLMHAGQWAVIRRQLGRPPLY